MDYKKCLIAAAGSGKTTFLINEIWEHYRDVPAIIVTYTTTNQITIREKIRNKFGFHPSRIKVLGWYEFLFKYIILPYKPTVLPQLNTIPVSLLFDPNYSRTRTAQNGKQYSRYRKDDIIGKFFSAGWKIHKDLVSEFACKCAKGNENSISQRLNEAANVICFDESQDFGGDDFIIIRLIARLYAGTVLLATDPRQHIYTTTKYGGKNSGRIDSYIETSINTKKRTYIELDDTTLSKSHRCIEPICNLASELFSTLAPTVSCCCPECIQKRIQYNGLKGVYAIPEKDIEKFVLSCHPLNLIYNNSEKSLIIGKRMTMGDSKGTESNVVLLYPTEDMAKFLFNNRNLKLHDMTRNKLYVGITRARYLLGIVYREKYQFQNNLIPIWRS